MGKLNKISLGLITELASIRDELGSALDRIEGEGRSDVLHAYGRLADLTANATVLLGQFDLKNVLKLLRRRGSVVS